MHTDPNRSSGQIDAVNSSVRAAALPQADESIGQLVHFLRKRGWLILLIGAVGLACGMGVYSVTPKEYTATTSVEVTADMSSEFRLESAPGVSSSMSVDNEKLDTEIQILSDRSLALTTIRSLGLDHNPDFLKPRGRPWDLSRPQDRATLAGQFLRDLLVTRNGHTSIIQISFTTTDPMLSQQMANALVDNYIERTFKDSYNSTVQVSVWLNGQLGDLKARLDKSQNRLLQLQKEIGLVGSLEGTGNGDHGADIMIANLTELQKQLVDAESDRLVKEATLQTIQSSPDAVLDAFAAHSPGMEAIKETLVQLNSQYLQLSQTYGKDYPRIKELKAQMAALEAELAGEESAQRALLSKQADAAKKNESMLRGLFNSEQQSALDNGSKMIQYELALREYEANRNLFDGLQGRLQEAGIISGLHSTSVHVIGAADTPVSPSKPRRIIDWGGGLGIGMLLGMGFAFFLEAVDVNLKSIAEIEGTVHLPLLAVLPLAEPEVLRPAKFTEQVASGIRGESSRIAEALRGMRTSILLSSPGSPPQVLLVTSSRPAEGKSSISILEAIIFALNGSRVLLIDADLRRPMVHRHLGEKTAPINSGLSTVLTGKTTLDDAIQVWPNQTNLHFLPAGPVPPMPAELLGSKQMQELLAYARKSYDFVFIDTPPILAVTDAAILGHLADATILVLKYGDTRRQVILRSVEILERSGANILGTVINAVNLRSAEYSEYYGKKYYEYYGERSEE